MIVVGEHIGLGELLPHFRALFPDGFPIPIVHLIIPFPLLVGGMRRGQESPVDKS